MKRLRGRRAGASTRGRLPLLFAGALVAALALVALRVECIRLRYRLAETLREERDLGERARVLTAEVRELRDPRELRRRAAKLGFGPPARIVEVSPDVAAGPPTP